MSLACQQPSPEGAVQGRTYLARADGRSSDLQVLPLPGLPTSLRFPTLSSQCVRGAFVPVYRCGAVLDLHQIPYCYAGANQQTNSVREDSTTPIDNIYFLTGLELFESHGCAIHAVSETRWLRAIVEDVTKMRIASAAMHLSPYAEAVVSHGLDVLPGNRLPETGPAGAGLEFRV